jgi:hypothetical protein
MMSTTALKPVTTPIPVQLSETEFTHIPADLVVDRWTSDSERGLRRHFMFRQDVWTMFRGQISKEKPQ